ncbi:hypothetical protein [Methanoregula sp.]|uniref:hypothetical protein n=1 Tax=Methanoregula sp. TaxID=2052170 RepID=UPI00356962D9
MLTACKHFGKPWDNLTNDERKWEKPATALPNVGKRIADAENRDDLYFLADAMMAACKALEEINRLLRDMLEEAKRERQHS